MHSSPISLAVAAHGSSRLFVWLVCVSTFLIFLVAQLYVKSFWPGAAKGSERKIATDRAEKSCDAVLSFCALLIPATLGLFTWLNEKVGPGSYVAFLGCALLYFFALLISTAYLRFNLLWGPSADFKVDSGEGLSFGRWLTTVMCSITFGLVLLCIPILELGVGWLKIKEATASGAQNNGSQSNGGAKEVQCSNPQTTNPIVHVECNCGPRPVVPCRHKRSRTRAGAHPCTTQ